MTAVWGGSRRTISKSCVVLLHYITYEMEGQLGVKVDDASQFVL